MWTLHPELVARLERGARGASLTAAQLNALKECLSDGTPLTALPAELFRELFEAGLITPKIVATLANPGRWGSRLPGLALSPHLQISVQFRCGAIRLQGMEPSIGLFLDPDVVQAASALSRLFRNALRNTVEDSAVRGMVFPRDQAERLVQDIVHRWLKRHPRVRRWLQWSREDQRLQFGIPNPAALTREAPSFPDCELTLRVRKSLRSIRIPTDLLPGLAAVFDLLRGGLPSPASADALRHSSIGAALDLIQEVGGLLPASEAPPVLSPTLPAGAALAATHLGHAQVLVDSERHRILVDPVLYSWDDRYDRQPPTSRQLGRVDAIFFTHHHEDHLDTPSLLTLPHDVPIYVPPDLPGLFRPRLGLFLRTLGFRDVRALPVGDVVEFDDGLRVEAIPFHGESSGTLGWNASCYLVSRAGRNVLLHADASPDRLGRSILTTGALKKVVERTGPIDAIYGSWWQERQFAGSLGSTSMLLLQPDHWFDAEETCDCPPEYLADLVRCCGARDFLFYAESGEELFLPERDRSDYIRTVSFLWRSREEVAARLTRETGVRVTSAEPYLRLLVPREGPAILDPGIPPSNRS